MARQIITGIDIGTSHIKAIIAEAAFSSNTLVPKILGTGIAESKGLSRGYITNPLEAAESIRAAVGRAEKAAGMRVKRAYVSAGGMGLSSLSSTGSVVISRADLEVTEKDLLQAQEAAEQAIPTPAMLNRKIINTIPVEWKIDGQPIMGRSAIGFKAQKVEVRALFITCLDHHLSDLMKAVEAANIEVVDVVPAPMAASLVTLSKKQKRAGCLLADIGAETTSLVVFENSNLVSLNVYPIGGSDVTNDIALGLKVSLDEAEGIKLGGIPRVSFSKKKLDEIIFARLGDCFELIQGQLKALRRNSLLPAGAVLTGGSAGVNGIKTLAEEALELPAQVAEIHLGEGEKNRIKDNVWAVACGLVMVGFRADHGQGIQGPETLDVIMKSLRGIVRQVSDWISRFLP